MDKDRKRELVQAFRERERVQGVFAVRCSTSGEVWVSTSRNLDVQRNGVWSSLRFGGHPNKAVQAAWKAHGEDAFAYEIVEALDQGELSATGFDDLLKVRERYWREALGAKALVG